MAPQAEVLLADLTTGEEVLRTTRAMGEREQDLPALYPEVDLDVRFTDATTLAVAGSPGGLQDRVVDRAGAEVVPQVGAGRPSVPPYSLTPRCVED